MLPVWPAGDSRVSPETMSRPQPIPLFFWAALTGLLAAIRLQSWRTLAAKKELV